MERGEAGAGGKQGCVGETQQTHPTQFPASGPLGWNQNQKRGKVSWHLTLQDPSRPLEALALAWSHLSWSPRGWGYAPALEKPLGGTCQWARPPGGLTHPPGPSMWPPHL